MNVRPADEEAHRDGPGAAPGDVETRLRTALRDAMRTRAEAAERATAAAQCEHAGYHDRAERLRREAGILFALLEEMA